MIVQRDNYVEFGKDCYFAGCEEKIFTLRLFNSLVFPFIAFLARGHGGDADKENSELIRERGAFFILY